MEVPFGIEEAIPDFGGHVSREVTLCFFGTLASFCEQVRNSKANIGVKFSSMNA